MQLRTAIPCRRWQDRHIIRTRTIYTHKKQVGKKVSHAAAQATCKLKRGLRTVGDEMKLLQSWRSEIKQCIASYLASLLAYFVRGRNFTIMVQNVQNCICGCNIYTTYIFQLQLGTIPNCEYFFKSTCSIMCPQKTYFLLRSDELLFIQYLHIYGEREKKSRLLYEYVSSHTCTSHILWLRVYSTRYTII